MADTVKLKIALKGDTSQLSISEFAGFLKAVHALLRAIEKENGLRGGSPIKWVVTKVEKDD